MYVPGGQVDPGFGSGSGLLDSPEQRSKVKVKCPKKEKFKKKLGVIRKVNEVKCDEVLGIKSESKLNKGIIKRRKCTHSP